MDNMDFGTVLHAAQANEHRVKKETPKCYRTTFSPPKKESKHKSLSVNIQKFLARKEEEEKQKELDAKKKRDELLALRSQDGKAKKRVTAMLKRTKAANKSAIEDAVDDDNTAVTINGPSQPDEDDYGYVSQEASAYYNKLMDKYNTTPVEEPLYSQSKKTVHKDLNSTKDRVRMALLKEEEEEMMPHKRKRRIKSKKADDPGDTTLDYSSSDLRDFSSHAAEEEEEEFERAPMPKSKPKRPAPPPMDFRDLLKLAEKKQFEPIMIEAKKKPEDEEERPMTKKQKVEYMKELEWRRRKEEAAKTGRGPSAQNSSLQNVQNKKYLEDQSLGTKQNDVADRSQEGSIKSGSQMRIPKLNSGKRDDRPMNTKGDDSLSNVKREEKPVAQKYPRSNGNYSQDRSFNNSSKSSIPFKDNALLKHSTSSDTVMKSKVDSVNNSLSKFPRGDSSTNQNKSLKSDFIPSAAKNLATKSVEGKHLGSSSSSSSSSSNVKKSALQSGYDKKLQEAIVAKMEETKKNAEIKNKLSSNESVVSKTVNKSVDGRERTFSSKDNGKSNSSFKLPMKPLKPDRPSEAIQKPQDVKQYQESSRSLPQNKPKIVPSTKPRELSSDSKSKTFPSNSKQQSNNDRARLSMQSDDRERNPSSDMRLKNVPAQSKERQLQMPSKSKQAPPNSRTEKISSSDVKPRQMPSPDRPRQMPPDRPRQMPPDRPRQMPPPDRPRQMPPPDRPRQMPPPDRPRQMPPPDRPRQMPPPDRPRQMPPPDRPRQMPPPDRPRQMPPPDRPRQMPPPDKPRQIPAPDRPQQYSPDVKSRQFPPADVRPRQFEPSEAQSRQFPPADVKKRPKPPVKRRITDSDEYDSEMDDFIDDGPLDEEDVSKHIREIFGYDRRKYSRIEDDDDECMESNYASILKEEFISTKSGILEDLEDIRREKEMEKRKKAMKKR